MKMLFCEKALVQASGLYSHLSFVTTAKGAAKSVGPNSARNLSRSGATSLSARVSAKTELPLPLMRASSVSGCSRNQAFTDGSHRYLEKTGGSRSLRRVTAPKLHPDSPVCGFCA